MNTININGMSYEVSGKNISISNGKVMVDGVLIKEGLSGDVSISFEGDLANLNVREGVTVNGDIHGDVDAGGSVTCGSVSGDVNAGGSVSCLNVDGDVSAGGSVSMKR